MIHAKRPGHSKAGGRRVQRGLSFISLAIPIGVLGGLVYGAYRAVFVERYLSYRMSTLLVEQLVESLSRWLMLTVAVFLLSDGLSWLLRRVAPAARWLEDERRGGYRAISLTLVTAAVGVLWGGYLVNHHWLPKFWSWRSLLGNALFLAASLLLSGLWYALVKRVLLKRLIGNATPLVALGCLLLIAGIVGTGSSAARSHGPKGPHVLFICIDALRPDHLGSSGYHRDPSPFLDELARDGVRFAYAYSQESYTHASVASFFTSLYPITHQVLYDKQGIDTFKPQYLTMAEVLKNAGFTTAAFVYNPHLRTRFGFHQGFDVYNDHPQGFDHTLPAFEAFETARKLLVETVKFVEAHRGKRLFVYLHYRDMHHPYAAPPPYHRLYAKPSETGEGQWFTKDDPGPDDVEEMVAQYDGEIRYTDDYLRELFRALQALHILEDTLVVINADHGEELWERHGDDPGFWNHGRTLYEEQIRVPLIFWGKPLPQRGLVVNDRVENIDILPTVLDLLALPIPPDVQGDSLVPYLEGKPIEEAKPVYSGGLHGRGMVIAGDWKYYRDDRTAKLDRRTAFKRPTPEDRWEFVEELYDLSRDPQEQRNVASHHPERLTALRAMLDEWFLRYGRSSLGTSRPLQPDAATTQELKSLGYLQ